MNKQQFLLPPSLISPIDTWKPIDINDLDEMERLQCLKQRENLLKSMGVIDLVNRILSGTAGTMAAVPPSLFQNSHQQDEAINSRFVPQGNKLEIRTKNYNPFENQSLFAEV